jgi:hypothetical protein
LVTIARWLAPRCHTRGLSPCLSKSYTSSLQEHFSIERFTQNITWECIFVEFRRFRGWPTYEKRIFIRTQCVCREYMWYVGLSLYLMLLSTVSYMYVSCSRIVESLKN